MRIGRLLILLPGDSFGAAEAHALRIGAAAGALGVAVTIAAEGVVLARLREQAAAGWFGTLLDLPVAWRRGAAETTRQRQAEATQAAIAAASPDAVMLSLPWPDFATGAMAVLAETTTPTLVVSHLAPRGGGRPPALDAAALSAAAAMRAEWVAVSPPVAERTAWLLGLPEGRVTCIPDAADPPPPLDREACRAALRAQLGVGPGVPVALFLGRLEAARGADRLAGLAKAFAARTSGVIACAGAGILQAALREAAAGDHPLRFLDPSHAPDPELDAAWLLAGSDMLVLPSRLEGAPRAFLQAALAGRPVVASPEALEALGEDATRFAAIADADDLEAMAEALATCLDPQGPAPSRVEAAWHLASSWAPDAMVARYLGRLRRLAAPPLVVEAAAPPSTAAGEDKASEVMHLEQAAPGGLPPSPMVPKAMLPEAAPPAPPPFDLAEPEPAAPGAALAEPDQETPAPAPVFPDAPRPEILAVEVIAPSDGPADGPQPGSAAPKATMSVARPVEGAPLDVPDGSAKTPDRPATGPAASEKPLPGTPPPEAARPALPEADPVPKPASAGAAPPHGEPEPPPPQAPPAPEVSSLGGPDSQ